MNHLSNDSLRSLTSGMGDINHDKMAGVTHVDRYLDDGQLQTSYRNSWIAAKIVDIQALDSLRKGRDWQAEEDQITMIEAEERRLMFWPKMLECRTKARLWGGAAILIGGDGDYAEEYDHEAVKKGGIPFLTVMSRREFTTGDLVRRPDSEWYGKPGSYMIGNEGAADFVVHPSRLIVQLGAKHPDPWNAGVAHGWADSVLQRTFEALLQTDSTSANIASLVFEANVDSFGIPDLMEKLASSEYEQRLLNRLTLAKLGKSVTKSLVHDTEEDYQRNTINFSGLPDVMKTFFLNVSGASGTPLTRFFGQSVAGLSNAGEGDMKIYHDTIEAQQTLEITPAMWRFDEALIRSSTGQRDDDVFYNWTPLEQLSEGDQADIGLKHAQATEIYGRSGLFDVEELRDGAANQIIENGFYPGFAMAMKDTPDYDMGGGDEPEPTAAPVTADAAPRTLYLRRDVLNGAEIAKWYTDQGVSKVYAPESMHTTIIYTKKPIDWMKFGQTWESKLEVAEGGPRLHEKFGEAGDVLVLAFANYDLQWRHERAIELGASFDFDEYQPHISLTLEGRDVDLDTLKPWLGKIEFGPEIFEEIKTDEWRSLVVTNDLFGPI